MFHLELDICIKTYILQYARNKLLDKTTNDQLFSNHVACKNHFDFSGFEIY